MAKREQYPLYEDIHTPWEPRSTFRALQNINAVAVRTDAMLSDAVGSWVRRGLSDQQLQMVITTHAESIDSVVAFIMMETRT